MYDGRVDSVCVHPKSVPSYVNCQFRHRFVDSIMILFLMAWKSAEVQFASMMQPCKTISLATS